VVDVKNPEEGSLGAGFPWVISEVRRIVPAHLPVSAAIGDFPHLPGSASLAALGALQAGADLVKVGLKGSRKAEQALSLLRAVGRAVREFGRGEVVACAYGDFERAGTLDPLLLPELAREAGIWGVMLDTALKDGRAPHLLPVRGGAQGVLGEGPLPGAEGGSGRVPGGGGDPEAGPAGGGDRGEGGRLSPGPGGQDLTRAGPEAEGAAGGSGQGRAPAPKGMRVLLLEFASCTGTRPSLLPEGFAMLRLLAGEFEEAGFRPLSLLHRSLRWLAPLLPGRVEEGSLPPPLHPRPDAVLLLAPPRELVELTGWLERRGVKVLGTGEEGAGLAGDKWLSYLRLKGEVRMPPSRLSPPSGGRWVVKPRWGAGGEGGEEGEEGGAGGEFFQRFVEGTPASCCLLAGEEVRVLSLNRQLIRWEGGMGEVPGQPGCRWSSPSPRPGRWS